jgi:hypothetical protein
MVFHRLRKENLFVLVLDDLSAHWAPEVQAVAAAMNLQLNKSPHWPHKSVSAASCRHFGPNQTAIVEGSKDSHVRLKGHRTSSTSPGPCVSSFSKDNIVSAWRKCLCCRLVAIIQLVFLTSPMYEFPYLEQTIGKCIVLSAIQQQ